jgi:hypothetical protein
MPARKPQQPPQLTRWGILYTGKKAKLLLGKVRATDEREAIEKGAVQFWLPATKLIAVRRP